MAPSRVRVLIHWPLVVQVIKANDDLTPEHHQFFLYQMLRGLKYIHTGVMRCTVCNHYVLPR